jgi:hypothetical protein
MIFGSRKSGESWEIDNVFKPRIARIYTKLFSLTQIYRIYKIENRIYTLEPIIIRVNSWLNNYIRG